MKVETYEDTDVKTETFEQTIEARQLINELGLDGQASKLAFVEDGASLNATTKRFPYRLMTDEELFVYRTLCPQVTSLKNYDLSPIPLEVLKTAAYAKSLGDPRISHMDVWSATSVKVKDPVLVGKEGPYGSKFYILARWGEELLPLDVLIPDAIKKWHANYCDKLNDIIAEAQRALAKPCPQAVPSSRTEPVLYL